MDRIEGKLRLSVLDRDNDGFVTVEDIHVGLRDFLGLSVDDNYTLLAKQVHTCADVTGNGLVSVEDFEIFCRDGMSRELSLSTQWEEAFPDPLPDPKNFYPLSKRRETESAATLESNSSNSSPFPQEITIQHVVGDS